MLPRLDRDNWWSQERGGFESKEHTRGATIAVGVERDNWQYKFGYTSGYSQFVAFTRDDGNYNSDNANGCNGECLPTTWGYNRQTEIAATAIRYFDWFGVGADIVRVDWTHARHESEDGDYSKRITRTYKTVDYELRGRVSLKYGPVFLEYSRAAWTIARDGVCCPPARESFSIGLIGAMH
jgi:hypothetical protein